MRARREARRVREGEWPKVLMGARVDERHVVALLARIVSCEPPFKPGQDERAATFAEIVAGHTDAAVVAAMLRNRPDDAS